MTPQACPRETEVLDLVAIGQWPRQADAALVAHVDSCALCADLVIVARAMADTGDAASVRVPDAGFVWLRAQLSAREDAARRAARPLWLAQVAAAALMVVAAVFWSGGVADWSWRATLSMWSAAGDLLSRGVSTASGASSPVEAAADSVFHWFTLAAVLAAVLIVPLALGLSRLADGGEESQ